ncbi:docking protein 1b [Gouania willdenowi]|uniref:Uncharacterized LOC114480880 n=1 Tax=Gouania willdenowi TaxID=441366 RepID=A0A8C5H5E2_GOUWI|nr:uncharacterized protein LOC114480880 [Gouania willdenowi]
MDTQVKEGQLYVQHQKFGKKWKKNWFVLYPASQNGIARLEFFDSASGGGAGGGSGGGTNEKTRKLDKKIIRLSECISILPALTESCPKENMAAFCVETNDKMHVFAAEKQTAKDWMEIMCDIAFQGGSTCSTSDSNGGSLDLQMSENLIYCSREEVNEFWVSVQLTEASERCGLAGNYWLKVEGDVLILKDPKTKRNILVWPYKLLRRYGRDRMMFSFDAGRRCDSGPGNFTFDTKQGNEIFSVVDQAIQSQKALAQERRISGLLNYDPDCPTSLQHMCSTASGGTASGSGDSSSCSSREADGDSGGSKPGSADGVLGKREGGDSGNGKAHKGRSLPELPAVLGVLGGGIPANSHRGQAGKGVSVTVERAGFYSEPVDSVRLPTHTADGLYSDPVDSIKGQSKTSNLPVPTPRLQPVGDDGDHMHQSSTQRNRPDLYAHVYDQITLELHQKTSALNLNEEVERKGRKGKGAKGHRQPPGGQKEENSPSTSNLSAEHIYDEPEGCAKRSAVLIPAGSGMTIYDEAHGDLHFHRRPEEVEVNSGSNGNYSFPSWGTASEQQKHSSSSSSSSSQLGSSQIRQQPPAQKWPKPITAPKPGRGIFSRKKAVPLPLGKRSDSGSNNNNNNIWGCDEGAGGAELYSKVSKQKPPPANLWYSQHHRARIRSPDIIYDNLGNI